MRYCSAIVGGAKPPGGAAVAQGHDARVLPLIKPGVAAVAFYLTVDMTCRQKNGPECKSDADHWGWRRECQSIPIDVKAVFHSSTWEPTVLATGHWPISCARCAPSLCAIFRRPGRGRQPGNLRLRRRRSEEAERADRSQRLLEELRAAVLNGHSRGGLPQVRQLKDALRGKTCCSCFLFFQVSP